MNQQLKEGLRALDLEQMIESVFEIDTFRSKMGEDPDVCVLTFKVKDRAPAKDLMEYIEKGFNFVLDADTSSGENNNGEYYVFVEIQRSARLPRQVKDITDSVERLTGIKEWGFKFHKSSEIKELNEDNLKSNVPLTPNDYNRYMNKLKTESIKRFFNRTLMDDLILDENTITIVKPYDQKIKFQIIKQGDNKDILENVGDPLGVDETSASQIFWMTKVMGDYSIEKIGENFLFTNANKSLLLKRIDQ